VVVPKGEKNTPSIILLSVPSLSITYSKQMSECISRMNESPISTTSLLGICYSLANEMEQAAFFVKNVFDVDHLTTTKIYEL